MMMMMMTAKATSAPKSDKFWNPNVALGQGYGTPRGTVTDEYRPVVGRTMIWRVQQKNCFFAHDEYWRLLLKSRFQCISCCYVGGLQMELNAIYIFPELLSLSHPPLEKVFSEPKGSN